MINNVEEEINNIFKVSINPVVPILTPHFQGPNSFLIGRTTFLQHVTIIKQKYRRKLPLILARGKQCKERVHLS